jgi:5-hydroxyisourate hydrolase-like protein (transthyretin family)
MTYAYRLPVALFALTAGFLISCSQVPEKVEPAEEVEAEARTEFTERVENFFEYAPLKAGQPSQFRIHLTDLRDGSPVESAQVVLKVSTPGSGEAITSTTALVGKVTGIYVAELTIPKTGPYDIEFHIKNSKLDERMLLSDFRVE